MRPRGKVHGSSRKKSHPSQCWSQSPAITQRTFVGSSVGTAADLQEPGEAGRGRANRGQARASPRIPFAAPQPASERHQPQGHLQRIDAEHERRPALLMAVDRDLREPRSAALIRSSTSMSSSQRSSRSRGSSGRSDRRPEELEPALRVVEPEVEQLLDARREHASLQVPEQRPLDRSSRHLHARPADGVSLLAPGSSRRRARIPGRGRRRRRR